MTSSNEEAVFSYRGAIEQVGCQWQCVPLAVASVKVTVRLRPCASRWSRSRFFLRWPPCDDPDSSCPRRMSSQGQAAFLNYLEKLLPYSPLRPADEQLRSQPLISQFIRHAAPFRAVPMLLTAQGTNWLSWEDAMVNLAFLLKQTL